jgi:hypothetical protein
MATKNMNPKTGTGRKATTQVEIKSLQLSG